jgi:hypothetical protein
VDRAAPERLAKTDNRQVALVAIPALEDA